MLQKRSGSRALSRAVRGVEQPEGALKCGKSAPKVGRFLESSEGLGLPEGPQTPS